MCGLICHFRTEVELLLPAPHRAGAAVRAGFERQVFSEVSKKWRRFMLRCAHIGRGQAAALSRVDLLRHASVTMTGRAQDAVPLRNEVEAIDRTSVMDNHRDFLLIAHGVLLAGKRLEIKKDGSAPGDLTTKRIVIEGGAYFKGAMEISRKSPPAREETLPARAEKKTL